MSLFEKLKNKRYDLQESGPNDPKFYTGETEDKFQGSKEGKKLKNIKKKSTPSLTRGSGIGPTERINPDDTKTQKTQNKIANQRVKSAQKSGKIDDFTNKPIEGAPDTKKLVRGKKGETIANPIKPTKKTKSKTSGTTQLKGVKDTELNPKTTGDESQFRRNARRRKITGDVIPKKNLSKTKGVNQADVSKKAQEFTKKVNKERIVKQKNIFGGEDTVKTKRKVGSTTSRGTKTQKKFIDRNYVPGQQSLDLGGDVTKKTPKPRLSKSGEVVTDLRTTGRKPRNIRKRRIDAKPPKPEKMVVAKDPVKGGFKKVGATTKQGREVLKKQYVSTAKLLDPTPKPKPPTTKPNLFSRIKNFVKREPKIPGDYNVVRGTTNKPLSVTRKVYKGKLGAVRKFVDKLPRKYKLAGTALIATAAAVPSIKKAFAPKPEKKSYTVANKTLKLDTGKKNT